MNRHVFMILTLFSVLFFGGFSQKVMAKDAIPAHDSFDITSKALGEKRVISVWKPSNYDQVDQRFPVLYMPDGGIDEDFPHIANTISELVERGVIAPLLVVGIKNTDRYHDLTAPSKVAQDLEWLPTSGGSEAFRTFIRDELIPEVETRYRVTAQRAIVGESLAGLFVMECFLREPGLFETHVAMDPSLWWNAQKLVGEAEQALANLPEGQFTLWFAGSDAKDIYIHTTTLEKTLKKHAPKHLKWMYSPQPNEQHKTIFRATKEQAFSWALWRSEP